MKRLLSLVLLLILLLTGCADRIREPVVFYYVRTGYEENMSAVLGAERREASGHRDDLSYLLALYLMGPTNEELHSPLPAGTRMFSAQRSGTSLTLYLSDTTDSITDIQFTLACSCLTMTCMELTDVESVTIHSGDRSITMDADTLLLQDPITVELEDSQ